MSKGRRYDWYRDYVEKRKPLIWETDDGPVEVYIAHARGGGYIVLFCPQIPELKGMSLTQAKTFVARKMDEKFIGSFGRGARGQQTYGFTGESWIPGYFEHLADKIGGLLDKWARDYNQVRSELQELGVVPSQISFLTPWHEFAYSVYAMAPERDRAMMAQYLAAQMMETRGPEWVTDVSFDIFMREFITKAYVVDIPYEKLYAQMWEAAQKKTEDLRGTFTVFEKSVQDLRANAYMNEAQATAAKKYAFEQVTETVEERITELMDSGKAEDQLLARNMRVDFWDAKRIPTEARMAAFWGKYVDVVDPSKVLRREGVINKQALEITRLMGDVQEQAIKGHELISGVTPLDEKPLRKEYWLDPEFKRIEKIKGRRDPWSPQTRTRYFATRQEIYRYDQISKQLEEGLPEGTFTHEGLVRQDRTPLGQDRASKIHPGEILDESVAEEQRAQRLREKVISPTQATDVPKVEAPEPPKPKVVISRAYRFGKKGVFDAEVRLSGFGHAGVLSDAVVRRVFAKYGGDRNALKKAEHAIALGTKEALHNAIRAMIPTWYKMVRDELQRQGLGSFAILPPPDIIYKTRANEVTATIKFKWRISETPRSQAAITRREQGITRAVSTIRSARTAIIPKPDPVAVPISIDRVTPIGSDVAATGDGLVQEIRRVVGAEPDSIISAGIADDGSPVIITKRYRKITRVPKPKEAKVAIPEISAYKLDVTEPQEPVSDSFRAAMRQIMQRGGGGNIFQRIANILWAIEIPLPDYNRVLRDEAKIQEQTAYQDLEKMTDQELNEEIARARTKEGEKRFGEIVESVIQSTNYQIVNQMMQEEPQESADLWNRLVT